MPTRARLDQALRDAREANRLTGILAALGKEIEGARRERDEATARYRSEAKDVARLEGVGWGALVSAVRGTRTGELERERAEEVAARYAAQSATERLARLDRDYAETQSLRAVLGNVEERREEAAREHASALRLAGSSPELESTLDRLATLDSELREIDEALAAGQRARGALAQAQRQLGSADAWSGYDTFLGGGIVSSMVKHDRLDQAGRAIANAQHTLATFSRELSDVPQAQQLSVDLGISPTTRTLDIWFDNIFSDLAVRDQIKTSLRALSAASGAVDAAFNQLNARQSVLKRERADALHRRDQLIGA